MKKFMKNLMKLMKKNTVSVVLSIILLVLIVYFIIDILKNNNIIENMTCEGEEGEEGEECEEEEEQGEEEQGEEEQGEEEEMSETEELQEIVEDMEEEDMGAVVAMDMLSEMEGSILTNGEVVMEKPDTQSFRFNTPTPININVSYNNKNVVNDSNIDIDEANLGSTRSESSGDTMKSSTEEVSPNGNNNYGTVSWNLTSDYYIPGVTNVNQNYNQQESNEENNGYPYMYGRPWSNYMSGDHNK